MGSTKTDNVTRKRMRVKFRSWGMAEDEIEACMKQIAQRQLDKRRGILGLHAPLCTRSEYVRLLRKNKPGNDNSASVLHLGEYYEGPDDKGYKPTQVHSVLTGMGRAIGATAKAVKRRGTITKYDYHREEN